MSYNEELQKNEILNSKGGRAIGKTTKDVLEHTKAILTMNTDYAKTNEYLSKQLELLQQLNALRAEANISIKEQNTEQAIANELENASTRGVYSDDNITTAVNLERQAKLDAEEEYYNSLAKIDEKGIIHKYKKETDAMIEEAIKQEAELEKLKKTYDKRKKDYDYNIQKKNISKASRVQLKKEHEWLLDQEAEFKRLQLEMEEKFQKKKDEINSQRDKELADAMLQKEVDAKAHANKIAEINSNADKAIREAGQEAQKLADEYALERIKSISETANSFIQNSLEYYIRVAETRMKQLDTYMTKLSNQMDFLQAKVASGSITAQESLAKVEQEQQEAEKRKLKEQRKAQRLQIAQTVFNAYNSNVQNSKVGENALTKTLSDVTLLSAFIGSLPTYFDGTEDTGMNGQGLDGKGGFHAILHPNERVIPKELNMKMGDLSNIEIAKLAEDKVRGNIMSRGEGAISLMNNSWQTELIISELKDLKNTIKNKPETNVEVGEILGGVMKIVETKKMGNQTTRNITRLS